MRKVLKLALAAVATIALSVNAAGQAAVTGLDPTGVWRNPDNTLRVRISAQGPLLTGTIVWAAPSAISDARDSGVRAPLVGTQLLRDYRRTGPRTWKGDVYVPDMQGTFSSHLVAKNASALDISGCVLAGLVCKHQTWQRA